MNKSNISIEGRNVLSQNTANLIKLSKSFDKYRDDEEYGEEDNVKQK
jgi:hypothetical protein